jgi:hypothetical protein
MRKYEDGDYMALNWMDGEPEAYYIKGHVIPEHGRKTLLGEGAIDSEEEVLQGKHKYARWSMESTDDGNRHILRVYDFPANGRFKITEYEIKTG